MKTFTFLQPINYYYKVEAENIQEAYKKLGDVHASDFYDEVVGDWEHIEELDEELNTKKYQVAISRNETTVYYIEVNAEDEGQAEELACERYNENNYDYSKVVFGEEEVHSIEEIK